MMRISNAFSCLNRRTVRVATAAGIWFTLAVLPLKAQYLGNQLPGTLGIQAGTQPPEGIYLTLPLYYRHSDISLYDAQGNQILKNFSADLNLFMLPSLMVITPFKIFGGNVGVSFTQWIDNGVINVAAGNFQRSSSYGYGDLYVQPLMLGWHTPHADVTTGYAFFAPTGSGTAGRHMWVNEVDFGTTFYFDSHKNYHVSTMVLYDYNLTKNNTNVNVGDVMTWLGGAGRSFLKGAGSAGVAYSAQWKMTHDSGPDIPSFVPISDGRNFGVGPEFNTPVFAKGHFVGVVQLRYLWWVGAKTAVGGQSLTASFTLAKLGWRQ